MRGKTNSVTTSGGSTESTLKKLLDNTQSTYCLFDEYQGTSVTDIISYNDTENVTRMESMFIYSSKLTSIPLLNTSKVTNMQNMFMQCKSLTTIPLLDTSNVTKMYQMFNNCLKLTTIPLIDTSNVTNMLAMFKGCSALTTIPPLDTSRVINMDNMFSGCSNLENIHMTGMAVSFNISASTLFTTEALHEIIGNLATVTSSKTLTMGSTNLAKVSEEYKTIATNKGWTLA